MSCCILATLLTLRAPIRKRKTKPQKKDASDRQALTPSGAPTLNPQPLKPKPWILVVFLEKCETLGFVSKPTGALEL